VLRGLWSVFAGWVGDQRESWRRWLAWRRQDHPLRHRDRELRAALRREIETAAARSREHAADPSQIDREVWERFRPRVDEIERQRALPETRFLLFEAERFNVRPPPSDQWYREQVDGEWALDPRGLRELRESVAAERRRRREPVVAYVGVIGALTGLVAVSAAYCGRERTIVVRTPPAAAPLAAPAPTSTTSEPTSTTTSSSTTTSTSVTSTTTSSTTSTTTRHRRGSGRRRR